MCTWFHVPLTGNSSHSILFSWASSSLRRSISTLRSSCSITYLTYEPDAEPLNILSSQGCWHALHLGIGTPRRNRYSAPRPDAPRPKAPPRSPQGAPPGPPRGPVTEAPQDASRLPCSPRGTVPRGPSLPPRGTAPRAPYAPRGLEAAPSVVHPPPKAPLPRPRGTTLEAPTTHPTLKAPHPEAPTTPASRHRSPRLPPSDLEALHPEPPHPLNLKAPFPQVPLPPDLEALIPTSRLEASHHEAPLPTLRLEAPHPEAPLLLLVPSSRCRRCEAREQLVWSCGALIPTSRHYSPSPPPPGLEASLPKAPDPPHPAPRDPYHPPPPTHLWWSDISDILQIGNSREKFDGDCGTTAHPLLRRPFAVLAQNLHNAGESLVSHQTTTENVTTKLKEHSLNKMIQRNRLLMQQAELLSSLAMKVDIQNTDQSLESAWKILQDFLQQTKDGDTLKFQLQLPKMNFEPDDYKNLIADSRSSNEGSRPSWRY
ncbi:hypothetical protein KY290_021873 [Solanum tuberosum]|uniref:Uncharacterized protein n=1 Tax=Solanum tuberosum TaxID=4113 RepID=A0ABQ7V5V4_SOLTU|nr:hypothetical protein KY289_021036 [Solanum tuberosum]KAH0758380.1 hypothetical protein KY290_021873 [Solanum tuberosum]